MIQQESGDKGGDLVSGHILSSLGKIVARWSLKPKLKSNLRSKHGTVGTGGEGIYNQWIHCDLIVIF